MKYRVILWDWNGTLADGMEASLKSTNDILARRNMPPISREQYYSYIDTPISRFYEHLFDLNEVTMEIIGQEFYESYPKHFQSLHQGVEALLAQLQTAGVRQVILTSGNTQVVDGYLRRFGIREHFESILGADDLLATSKVERGIAWMQNQQIPAREAIMLGDTLHDYDVAKAMGIDCILFSGGHQSRRDLQKAGVPLVDSFEEFRKYLF